MTRRFVVISPEKENAEVIVILYKQEKLSETPEFLLR